MVEKRGGQAIPVCDARSMDRKHELQHQASKQDRGSQPRLPLQLPTLCINEEQLLVLHDTFPYMNR
jgi:hypothetical protein